MKEEYAVLEYNQTTTEVELINVSASWDEVCSCLYVKSEFVYFVKLVWFYIQDTCILSSMLN